MNETKTAVGARPAGARKQRSSIRHDRFDGAQASVALERCPWRDAFVHSGNPNTPAPGAPWQP